MRDVVNQQEDLRTIRWMAWVSLAAFTLLWIARWPSFPMMLDPYYHALVAEQLRAAGGPMVFEWWECAPVGRTHLYPPLLHLLLAGLFGFGCSPLLGLRLATAVSVPAALGSIYLVMKRLVGPAAGLAGLWMGMVGFTWALQLAGALASGLATIELLWLMAAAAERRVVAGACLVGLLCYTHLGLPWVAVATLLWSWGLGAFKDRRVVAIVIAGLMIGAPWLVHVARHVSLLHVTGRYENETIEVMVLLYTCAAIGAWSCWHAAGRSRILLGLWLGCLLIARSFPFRWISGEGLLGVILLAGYGVDQMSGWLASRWPLMASRGLVMLALGAVVMASPSLLVHHRSVAWRWPDSSPVHLLNWPVAKPKSMDVSLYERHMEQLVKQVGALSRPGEILWCNAVYTGGLVAAFAHRAMSTAMFYEVPPASAFDPMASAHLVIWFKMMPSSATADLGRLVARYHLIPVAETEIAQVFRQPGVTRLAGQPHAVIPFWLSDMVVCILLGAVLWDFRSPTRQDVAWQPS